jgi:four helix bundle protein
MAHHTDDRRRQEADDGSSRKDFLAKERISLREIKETRLRLRVLHATGFPSPSEETLIDESTQLVKIVSACGTHPVAIRSDE